MTRWIECEGAPRDLGLAQGRACRPELARVAGHDSWLDRLEDRLPGSSAGRRLRDLKRHFPHQSESIAGLAVGAGVSELWLVKQLEADDEPVPLVAVSRDGALLARAFDGDVVVRHSRPEGLFASVELTRPWLTTSLLGVNERGLGVAVSSAAGTSVEAPALLLAQDCLERFEHTAAAIEWCSSRPAAGPSTLFVVDAEGDAAGIELLDSGRRVLCPTGGVLVAGAGARSAELAKELGASWPTGAEDLAWRVGDGTSAVADPAGPALWVAGERYVP